MKRRRHDRHQEPKLSQEDWDAILDSAIAASSKKGRSPKEDLESNIEGLLLQHKGSHSIHSRPLRLSKVESWLLQEKIGLVVVCVRSRCRDSKNRPSETSYDSEIGKKGASLAEIIKQGLQKSNQRKLRCPCSDLRLQYWYFSCTWPSGTRYGPNHAQGTNILKALSRK